MASSLASLDSLLVEEVRGRDTNRVRRVLTQLRRSRRSPLLGQALLEACRLPSSELVLLLVQHGADVMARDSVGQAPLHVAAAAGDPTTVQVLLDRGVPCDLLCRDRHRSALHYASAAGHVGVVRVLLQYGAAPDALDSQRQTPLDLANPECAAAFAAHASSLSSPLLSSSSSSQLRRRRASNASNNSRPEASQTAAQERTVSSDSTAEAAAAGDTALLSSLRSAVSFFGDDMKTRPRSLSAPDRMLGAAGMHRAGAAVDSASSCFGSSDEDDDDHSLGDPPTSGDEPGRDASVLARLQSLGHDFQHRYRGGNGVGSNSDVDGLLPLSPSLSAEVSQSRRAPKPPGLPRSSRVASPRSSGGGGSGGGGAVDMGAGVTMGSPPQPRMHARRHARRHSSAEQHAAASRVLSPVPPQLRRGHERRHSADVQQQQPLLAQSRQSPVTSPRLQRARPAVPVIGSPRSSSNTNSNRPVYEPDVASPPLSHRSRSSASTTASPMSSPTLSPWHPTASLAMMVGAQDAEFRQRMPALPRTTSLTQHNADDAADDALTQLAHAPPQPQQQQKRCGDAGAFEIPFHELSLTDSVGIGGFGEVFRGWWRQTEVAVKRLLVSKVTVAQIDTFRREVAIMQQLRHPNVVLFMGASTTPPNLAIVTEFMPRGSLFDVLHDASIDLPWSLLVRMAIDSAQGMNYLHCCTPPIIHRDLKSLNLLVDDSFNVKVCDFGYTRVKATTYAVTQCGTPAWMSPECLRGERYDEKADVYSFGIVLWEMLSRRLPYAEYDNPLQVVGLVGYRNPGLRPVIPSSCHPALACLIRDCWAEVPSTRPSFSQILTRLRQLPI